MNSFVATIAVAFLARGADAGWHSSCARFLGSYRWCCPGVKHSLYVIFRGFPDAGALDEAKELFSTFAHKPVSLGDNSFDIGAYIEWANQIDEDLICVLNTPSEILAEDWLRKLAVNLALPNVGLVGATGSYESLSELKKSSPVFPNPHIRLNAFMIDRESFCRISKGQVIADKLDAFDFESGRRSLTRQILAMGRGILLAGSQRAGLFAEVVAGERHISAGHAEEPIGCGQSNTQIHRASLVGKTGVCSQNMGSFHSRRRVDIENIEVMPEYQSAETILQHFPDRILVCKSNKSIKIE